LRLKTEKETKEKQTKASSRNIRDESTCKTSKPSQNLSSNQKIAIQAVQQRITNHASPLKHVHNRQMLKENYEKY